jgi:hypothetical protein
MYDSSSRWPKFLRVQAQIVKHPSSPSPTPNQTLRSVVMLSFHLEMEMLFTPKVWGASSTCRLKFHPLTSPSPWMAIRENNLQLPNVMMDQLAPA